MNGAMYLYISMIIGKLRSQIVAVLFVLALAFTFLATSLLVFTGGFTDTHSLLSAIGTLALMFAVIFYCAAFSTYCDARRLKQQRCARAIRS